MRSAPVCMIIFGGHGLLSPDRAMAHQDPEPEAGNVLDDGLDIGQMIQSLLDRKSHPSELLLSAH